MGLTGLEQRGLELLEELGKRLDKKPGRWRGESFRERAIERWLKVRDRRGRMVPLRANRMQREFERRCRGRNIVLKARQLGATTWIAARYFVRTITRRGTLTLLVAHDQEAAEEIFTIVRRFWANLPEALRTGALRTGRANVRQLTFPLLESQYRVGTAADPDAGRGLTLQQLHASEVARWPRDAQATLASLRAALAPGGEVTLESTAQGAAGCFFEEWKRAEETGYQRHFYPWWFEPAYADDGHKVRRNDWTDEEKSLAERHGLTPAQIGFRRGIRAQFQGLAPQEYAEDAENCFLVSGECVFDVAKLTAMLTGREDEAPETGLLRFLPPARDGQYVIGVDPAAGGADGDYACAQVIDRKQGLQCAELRGKYKPEEMAKRVADLAREYNDALVAVEKNGIGLATCTGLETTEKYPNLYKANDAVGLTTNLSNRIQMQVMLGTLLEESPELFASPRLLKEMRLFVRHRNGETGASSGAHDDTVMAFGIAHYVRGLTSGKG